MAALNLREMRKASTSWESRVISSPVWGLRPLRFFLVKASNLPKPLSSISFSSLRAFFMIPSMASSTFLACCCFISDWAQIDLAISALVTVLLMVSSPESRCASDIFWCGPSGPVPFARTVE